MRNQISKFYQQIDLTSQCSEEILEKREAFMKQFVGEMCQIEVDDKFVHLLFNFSYQKSPDRLTHRIGYRLNRLSQTLHSRVGGLALTYIMNLNKIPFFPDLKQT